MPEAYLDYELGDLLREDSDRELRMSFHRRERNPFCATFPFLLTRASDRCCLSLGDATLSDPVWELDWEDASFPVKLATLTGPDCRVLYTRRFLMPPGEPSRNDFGMSPANPCLLQGLDGWCSLPEATLTALDAQGRLFVHVHDNKPASFGVVTRLDAHWAEISVATEKACRGRGYARGLVEKMTSRIRETGRGVIFVCENGNTPSIRIAESLGYSLFGEEILGYRRD